MKEIKVQLILSYLLVIYVYHVICLISLNVLAVEQIGAFIKKQVSSTDKSVTIWY